MTGESGRPAGGDERQAADVGGQPQPPDRDEPGTVACCGQQAVVRDEPRPVVRGEQLAPCCGSRPVADPPAMEPGRASWIDGVVRSGIGDVSRARTRLDLRDRVGEFQARWGIGRMRYAVPPGLYAVGDPTAESPVMVSANYKMSFDHLRGSLSGRDAWILVLDTRGINVWCAAGKGTFGTDELVRRIQSTALDRLVSHHTLVVPQLGATGVSAHLVRSRCGFRVIYGPILARDLPAFLDARMKARPEMRRVRFDLRDRARLVPVEIVTGMKYFLLAALLLVLLSGLSRHGYSLSGVRAIGSPAAALILGTFVGTALLGPLLLPWLPGRAFAIKGATLGLVLVGALAALSRAAGFTVTGMHGAAWAFLVPAVASFTLMNFTGATTFTSLSGVLREMRFAVPAQIAGGAVGLGLWLAGLFVAGGR